MPFSSFVALTNYFIQKPLLKRIEIVKDSLMIRSVLHGTLFTTAYAIPKLKVSDEAFDIMHYTV